jgi:hypothetical protein
MTAYERINTIPAWQGLAVFAVSALLFAKFPVDGWEAASKGKLFSALAGLSAAGLIHFLRRVYPPDILPEKHSQVAFHFCWISACAGLAGFFSPAIGIQIAVLGVLTATTGFLVYPIRQLWNRQLQGAAFLLVFSGFATDFFYQFFIAEQNTWKTVFWRFPLALLVFCAFLTLISRSFPVRNGESPS